MRCGLSNAHMTGRICGEEKSPAKVYEVCSRRGRLGVHGPALLPHRQILAWLYPHRAQYRFPHAQHACVPHHLPAIILPQRHPDAGKALSIKQVIPFGVKGAIKLVEKFHFPRNNA